MTYRPKLPTCPKCSGERGGHYYGCTNLPPRKDRTKPEPKTEEPCSSS